MDLTMSHSIYTLVATRSNTVCSHLEPQVLFLEQCYPPILFLEQCYPPILFLEMCCYQLYFQRLDADRLVFGRVMPTGAASSIFRIICCCC